MVASIDRTAYPRFKRLISARELAESYTPAAEEIVWARGRTHTEGHLLSLVVLLKCYQRLGYFPKLPDVPPLVVDHVRAALGVAADVVAGQEPERTLWRHRDFVRAWVGTRYQPRDARQIAETAIRAAVEAKDDPADLINVALDEVVRAGLELPGYSTFDKIATTVRTEFNAAVFVRVAARIRADPSGRAQLAGLLVTDPVSGRSGMDRLKAPAKAATLGKFKARLAYLAWLDGLGPAEQWLAGVSAQKIAHFVGQARTTDVGDLRDVGEDKRWTLMASLVHECRTAARDEVATMFCKRMAAIHKKGRERLEELREAHRAESERLLGVFGCRECGAGSVPGTPAATTSRATKMGAITVQPNEITEVLNRPISLELLARDLTRLAYVAKDGTPRNVPIGFTWNGSEIVMCTTKNAPKLPALRENPTVALTIDTEVHPPKVLLIRGRAELDVVDGIPEEYLEASGTYEMTPEQRVDWEAEVRSLYDGMVRIVVTPTWAKLIDFETTLPSAVEELARQRDERQRA